MDCSSTSAIDRRSRTALATVAHATAHKLPITAQNVGWDDAHSITGETSADDLTDIGCRYVILGHSELRLYLGETDDMIARMLQTALAHDLTPILCVGDTLDQHESGRSEKVVQNPAGGLAPRLPDCGRAVSHRLRTGLGYQQRQRPARLPPG